jgi:hypothetical protein
MWDLMKKKKGKMIYEQCVSKEAKRYKFLI